MSNIKSYGNKSTIETYAISKLEYYINKVLRAIGENDDDITWYICEESDLPNGPHLIPPVIENITRIANTPFINSKFGCCDYKTKEIWISTDALLTALSPSRNRAFQVIDFCLLRHFGNKKHNEIQMQQMPSILIRVIVDEITHIRTQADHGEAKYEEQWKKYWQMYFYGIDI